LTKPLQRVSLVSVATEQHGGRGGASKARPELDHGPIPWDCLLGGRGRTQQLLGTRFGAWREVSVSCTLNCPERPRTGLAVTRTRQTPRRG